MITSAIFLWVALVVAQHPDVDVARSEAHASHTAHQPPELGRYTSQGCFSRVPEGVLAGVFGHTSADNCQRECEQQGKNVMLLCRRVPV